MQKDIEIILIPLNVFSNYAYRVKLSNFYLHFYYGKTSKEDIKHLKAGKNGRVYATLIIIIAFRSIVNC